MEKNLFIINPKSFFFNQIKIKRFIQDTRIILNEMGRDSLFHLSRFSRDAIWVIKERLSSLEAEDTLNVYAVGGDGVLFDCLNACIGEPNTRLASIPYGKQNDFIRAFGENVFNKFKDVRKLACASSVKTDVINCSGNYALTNCCIGLEAYSNYRAISVNDKMNRLGELWPKCIYNSVDVLFGAFGLFGSIARQEYHVVIDGCDYSGKYGTINIANTSAYGGSLCSVPSAVPDDGYLDVLMYKTNPSYYSLLIMPYFIHGKWRKFSEKFVYRHAKKIKIYSEDHPMCVILDAEIFWEQELTIEMLPQAIDIIVPEGLEYIKREELPKFNEISGGGG
jgi:diacylglycerol kinase family enzyme